MRSKVLSNTRILVIDDDKNLRASVRRILKRSGFEVETAASGRIGLRLAMECPPDLILLDVTMPAMSGHDFLRRLRRLQDRPRGNAANSVGLGQLDEVPVIFLTGRSEPRQVIDGLDTDVIDYISKPVDPDELRARIRNQLRRAQRQKKFIASAKAELLRLESAISTIREIASASQDLLSDMNAYFDRLEPIGDAKSEVEWQQKARQVMQSLQQSIARIAEWSITKGF